MYGLKTKDKALDTAIKWMAEIADLREKHPLLVVMRDNTKENRERQTEENRERQTERIAGMRRTSIKSGIPHTAFYMMKRRTSPSADRLDAEDMCTCPRLGVRRGKVC